MRIWTTLLSVVIVSLMVCGYAQAAQRGKGGAGGHQMSFKDLAGSDDAKLTKDAFVKARTKNVPADQKEEMGKRAEKMWDRMANGKSELNKDEFEAAHKKMMEAFKAKGGRSKAKHGGGDN